MIFFKKTDFYGQLLLALLSLAVTAVVDDGFFIISYFVVGGWQVTSALIHMRHRTALLQVGGRHKYEVLLAILVACCLLSLLITPLLIFYLYLMLLAGPAMAVWYAYITWHELRIWEARAFIHQK